MLARNKELCRRTAMPGDADDNAATSRLQQKQRSRIGCAASAAPARTQRSYSRQPRASPGPSQYTAAQRCCGQPAELMSVLEASNSACGFDHNAEPFPAGAPLHNPISDGAIDLQEVSLRSYLSPPYHPSSGGLWGLHFTTPSLMKRSTSRRPRYAPRPPEQFRHHRLRKRIIWKKLPFWSI